MTANTQSFTTLPLSTLRVDEKSNVRKIGRGDIDATILASIKAHGLLQPLRVRPNGKGHVIIDGGQRFHCLQALVKAGDYPADYATPVIVDDAMNDGDAREISLASNIARNAMHPVDEFRAFSALHTDKAAPIDVTGIAKRFGVSEKIVAQRLALGALDESVLGAWINGDIDADDAKAFTLAKDKKQQAKVLTEVLKGDFHVNPYNIKRALKIGDDSMGKYLDVIGVEAYEARGGKITRDLFGTDDIVSDPGLVKAMLDELVTDTCLRLTSEGWAWATPRSLVENQWQYGRLQVEPKPTPAEKKLLKQYADICDDESLSNQNEEASEKYDLLEAEIKLRAFTSQMKAKAGCFVSVSDDGGIVVEYGRTAPKEEKAASPGKKKADEKKKPNRKPEDTIPANLLERLASQLTETAAVTLDKQPNVALAALLAGFASGDQACTVRSGVYSARGPSASFTTAFAAALKLSIADQVKALAKIAASAVNFVRHNSKDAALDNNAFKALCEAIDGKTFNAAARDKFDAKDFFASASRKTIVAAVAEAMGPDHAANVQKMDKPSAVKFATGNLPKLKWLPKQLRVSSYDGPKAKKAAPKKAAKKAAKRK